MSKKQDKKQELKALFYPNVEFDTLFIPYIYKEIYFEGIYIDVLNDKKDMTIVDVGANIGIVTDHMRPHAKKIYSIEPSSEHFAALKQNKEFNEWDNVEIFNMAIAGKDGEVTMHKHDANRTCNSYVLNYEGESQTVKAQAMDTFFAENNIEQVDFMKFDVEGAEDDILRSEGFKKVADKIKAIEVEFHFPSWPSLVEYMQTLGFQARRYEASGIIVLFFR
jgi:FkbM family methyltransferase